VVAEQLRAPAEEVCQRGAPFSSLDAVLLVDPNPRQFLPPPRQLIAAPRELLLRLEQLEPRREPLFTCPGLVLRHRSCLLSGFDVEPAFHDCTKPPNVSPQRQAPDRAPPKLARTAIGAVSAAGPSSVASLRSVSLRSIFSPQ